jgi:hypothetical protein
VESAPPGPSAVEGSRTPPIEIPSCRHRWCSTTVPPDAAESIRRQSRFMPSCPKGGGCSFKECGRSGGRRHPSASSCGAAAAGLRLVALKFHPGLIYGGAREAPQSCAPSGRECLRFDGLACPWPRI